MELLIIKRNCDASLEVTPALAKFILLIRSRLQTPISPAGNKSLETIYVGEAILTKAVQGLSFSQIAFPPSGTLAEIEAGRISFT